MTKYNYIIGSGWWCADKPADDTREKMIGSNAIREKDFHRQWYESITKHTSPQKIFILDSASPKKPELNTKDTRLEFLSINHNAGHATNTTDKYCGWTHSVLLGLEYAYYCKTDYFVYVEQDVLLYGNNIIEKCIEGMRKGYLFGPSTGTRQPLQQSFFIIKQSFIRRFVDRLHKISLSDKELSPEQKFYMASSRLPICFLKTLWELSHKKNRSNKKKPFTKRWKTLEQFISKNFPGHQEMSIGYGRTRPLNFKDKYFYFQHGNQTELQEYRKL